MSGKRFTGEIINPTVPETLLLDPSDIDPSVPITFTAFPDSGLDIQFEPIASVANFPQNGTVSGFLAGSNNTIIDNPGVGGTEFVTFTPGFPSGQGATINVSSFSQQTTGEFLFEVSAENQNDSFATPDRKGIISSSVTFNGFVGRSDQEDWYQFVTPATASSFTFTLSGLEDNADIEIFQEDGTTRLDDGSDEADTDDEIEELPLQASTTYFVKVKNLDNDSNVGFGQGTSTQYQLEITPGSGSPGSDTVSITSPSADDTSPGDPVPNITENAVNEFNGQRLFLFSNGNDVVTVPVGETEILGLSGNDNITGRDTSEQIIGNRGADTVLGAGGVDSLFGGEGSDSLDGGDGNDRLFGNPKNDTVAGGNGDDVLFGGRENDRLFGGVGNDTLGNDQGQEQMSGDAGSDVFELPATSVAATIPQQADIIMDYQSSEGDQLMLPQGIQESQLNLSSVNLQLDGGTAVPSTLIELNGTYLGILRDVDPSDPLTFIPFNLSAFS